MSQLNKDRDQDQDQEREREITVRALKAELVVVTEILRDETRPDEHKDDTYLDLRALSSMLKRMGECPAVTTTDPGTDNNPDPTSATNFTPIRYCTKRYHEEGDHEWL